MLCYRIRHRTEHPDTATTYNNMAGVYNNKGDYDLALEYFTKALAIFEKVLGKEHPKTILVNENRIECIKKKSDL